MNTAVGFLMVLLQKRMVSSVAAIRRTLERRLIALEHPEAAVLTPAELRELKEREDDEEALSDERREQLQQKLEAAHLKLNQQEHQTEITRVRKLVELARRITVDTKARQLRAFVEGVLQSKPEEKVLIFNRVARSDEVAAVTAADAPPGYRKGHGNTRRLALGSGTIRGRGLEGAL